MPAYPSFFFYLPFRLLSEICLVYSLPLLLAFFSFRLLTAFSVRVCVRVMHRTLYRYARVSRGETLLFRFLLK